MLNRIIFHFIAVISHIFRSTSVLLFNTGAPFFDSCIFEFVHLIHKLLNSSKNTNNTQTTHFIFSLEVHFIHRKFLCQVFRRWNLLLSWTIGFRWTISWQTEITKSWKKFYMNEFNMNIKLNNQIILYNY